MKDYQHNDNKEEVILSRVNFCNSCSLKKENEELKKETKRLSAVYEMNELLLKHQNSLKKEVHDLRKENAELKEQMGRAGYRIAELKMQIEKMKCCGNCKHNSKSKMYKNPCRQCFELSCWELTE